MIVLVVDNSLRIIESWQTLLLEIENITAVHGAVCFKDASTLFNEIKPGVVLLDSGLPENETIDLLKLIKESGAKTPVIVLSNRFDDYIERQCKSNGADFFFDKYHEFEIVPGVIKCIAANKI